MQEVAFVLCLSWSNSIEISSCKEPQLLSGPSVRTPCRGTASNSRGFVAQASWAGGLSARGEVGMEGAMRRARRKLPALGRIEDHVAPGLGASMESSGGYGVADLEVNGG